MTGPARGTLFVAKDRAELRRFGADVLLREIRDAVRTRGLCTMALSGGSTPGPVYEELGSSDLPWSQIEIYFADERSVPLEHPESNSRLVTETLLKSHPEALDRMFRMPADAPDREEAAQGYALRLPDPLDLLVLGMGPDGHTASLFPGSPALDETQRRVLAVTGPKPPFERMTIAPSVIERARSIVMIAAGAEKAGMLQRALSGPFDPKILPAQLARRGTWVVDAAAAAQLRS